MLSDAELLERIHLVEAAQLHMRTHRREYVTKEHWYDWQLDEFRAGQDHTEVMVLAGNQSGKTLSAAYEQALHITGDYPDWWEGDRIDHPGTHWVFGVDTTQLKNVVQQNILGEVSAEGKVSMLGGGWIHPDECQGLVPHPNKRGLLADLKVKHVRGGRSTVSLRTYTQTETGRGTLSFAGSKVDSIYVDEQPPDALIGQLAARRAMGRRGKGGIIRYTMTPELGLTELVRKFMEEPGPHQKLIGPIGWNNCPHMTKEKQEKLLGSIPEHEKDMRALGIPFFGSGMVYPVGEKSITCEPFEIPDYFKCIAGIDLGVTSNTAVAFVALDPETGVRYLYDVYAQADPSIAVHASAIKQRSSVPLVFPHDVDRVHGHGEEKGSGQSFRDMYEAQGLVNNYQFTNPDDTRFVEPGISALLNQMRAGEFKVFENCTPWFNEFRKYHRKDGKIVKVDDHLMDATRYANQMVVRFGQERGRKRGPIRVIRSV